MGRRSNLSSPGQITSHKALVMTPCPESLRGVPHLFHGTTKQSIERWTDCFAENARNDLELGVIARSARLPHELSRVGQEATKQSIESWTDHFAHSARDDMESRKLAMTLLPEVTVLRAVCLIADESSSSGAIQ
jgi:hypothetical protein